MARAVRGSLAAWIASGRLPSLCAWGAVVLLATGCGDAREPEPRAPTRATPCQRPDATRWTALGANPPTVAPAVPVRGTWIGREALFIGHRLGEPLVAAFFEPCGQRWESVSLGGAPTPLGQAAWIGGHLHAWGVAAQPSGARYDRGTRSWVPTPLPIAATRAPVLGARVVVLRGPLASPAAVPAAVAPNLAGSIYDVATGTARAVNPVGAPSPRVLAAVVPWLPTGEVLVFGGRQRETPEAFGDGALLDVSANQWRRLPPGAPSPRFAAVALTNASGVVIWGGRDATPLSDGARWLPAERRWLPIEADGAPMWSERGVHALTDRYFVVAAERSGARYDLAEGGWERFDVPEAMAGPAVAASALSDGSVLFHGGKTRPWFWRLEPGERVWSKVELPHPAEAARLPSRDAPREPATVVGGGWLLVWFGAAHGDTPTGSAGGGTGAFIQLVGG